VIRDAGFAIAIAIYIATIGNIILHRLFGAFRQAGSGGLPIGMIVALTLSASNTRHNLLRHLSGLTVSQQSDLHIQAPDRQIAIGIGYNFLSASGFFRCDNECVAPLFGEILWPNTSG
jgi:hypothetical protein